MAWLLLLLSISVSLFLTSLTFSQHRYQPKVAKQDDDADAKEDEEDDWKDCMSQSNIRMDGDDIVILMHGVKATGRNWIGLYKVDALDEDVGNRAMCVPAVVGTETYRKQQEMLADLSYPSDVRKALVTQREHIAHFVRTTHCCDDSF